MLAKAEELLHHLLWMWLQYSVPARDASILHHLLWIQAALPCITALHHSLATMFDMQRGLEMQYANVSCTRQAVCGALPAATATAGASADKAARPYRASHHVHGTSMNIFCLNASREYNVCH